MIPVDADFTRATVRLHNRWVAICVARLPRQIFPMIRGKLTARRYLGVSRDGLGAGPRA